ncbi:PREDICTED: myosin-9 [Fragaria vesca subsp. vesca]|uniref:myosin-9 n=1 Tax=Fragaria vesca subsp. vesca TaxID=101020 RepID=UPI0002C327F7|nr:PREDICTED: myosin-9 [Fragaria vesca subsp. vesca]
MASSGGGDDDADAVLSDVEGDDPVPIVIKNPSPEQISADRFRELLAELDRERHAREAVENSKSELQVQFGRLKALAHEAIKKRDEWGRQRDDALREKEELSRTNEKVTAELAEANRAKDEAVQQKEEISRQLDDVVKEKDGLRAEIGNSTHMLMSGIDKISGKVRNFKNFAAGGLPRSNKYTAGLPAVAYGVIKRTNEIVEELVRQVEATAKSRNETREQMDQRNYEIAIEISQLEATIGGLREEVAKKTSMVEDLEKSVAERSGKMSEIEREMEDKLRKAESEAAELRQLAREYDDKLMNLDSKMEEQRPLLVDQLNLVSKIHDRLYDVTRIVDANNLDQSDYSESMFLPQETDMEENLRASLAGMESIYELSRIVLEKSRDLVEEKNHEIKSLDETVTRLVKEKEQIGSLLRSALSNRMTSNSSSKTRDLFQVAEDGLREAGIDFKFNKHIGDQKVDALEAEDEVYTLAGALENIVKASQLEIIELQHSVEELRAELSLLKQHVEAQAKELDHRMHKIEELEEKERLANESIEGLMMDIAAAEEEITRWKVAAEQEAAAGTGVEQEFVAQLSALKQELEEAKQAIVESEKKLKFKEETADAAIAARDAAEKSLRLADSRASRLRERVEEVTRQLEEFENREDLRRGLGGPRYVCWPWQWLGLDFVGFSRSDTEQQNSSNEMELAEPLL